MSVANSQGVVCFYDSFAASNRQAWTSLETGLFKLIKGDSRKPYLSVYLFSAYGSLS